MMPTTPPVPGFGTLTSTLGVLMVSEIVAWYRSSEPTSAAWTGPTVSDSSLACGFIAFSIGTASRSRPAPAGTTAGMVKGTPADRALVLPRKYCNT